MRQIFTVFTYTLKEGARKKAFLVSTIIIMAVIFLLCLAPRVLGAIQKDGGEKDASKKASGTCYLVDETGIFEDSLEVFSREYPGVGFKAEKIDNLPLIKEKIAEKEEDFLVHIMYKEDIPTIHIVMANMMRQMFSGKGADGERITEICSQIWQKNVLSSQGVDEKAIAYSQTPLTYTQEQLQDMDIVSYVIGLVMLFIMFFAIYYYGYGVAMSVASEKTSRVMETLIISAKPSRILIGKCLAMGVLGILQLGVFLIFGAACVHFLLPKGFQIGGIALDFSSLQGSVIGILALVFILGYAFFAVINSVCGAAVSRVEDLNSAMMPVSILAMIGFYLGYLTCVAGGGSGRLSKLAMYLPISSPFTVPFKVVTGDIKEAELAVSISILFLSIVVIGVLSSKIYSASVMHYGKRLKWKDLRAMKIKKR